MDGTGSGPMTGVGTMIEPKGVLHFAISVKDLGRAKRFYRDILGCTYLRRNDNTAFMQAGEDYFVITEMKDHVPPNPPGGTQFHHAFIVAGDAFDAALESLKSHGVEILLYEDTGHRTFSGRHAYIQDPDGNAIEIIDYRGPGDATAPDYQGRKRRRGRGRGSGRSD